MVHFGLAVFANAAFRSVKSALTTNQTIEPTQIASFSQFFDDVNGTVAWRYGIGLDTRPIESIFSGVEISMRDLDQPFGRQTVDIREHLYLAYLYWIVDEHWLLGIEPRYDVFDRDERGLVLLTSKHSACQSLFDISVRPDCLEELGYPLFINT